MIVGIMGKIGAGKGAASEVLESMGFHVISFGDLVREETAAAGLELNRENTDKISKMRTQSNPNYWREKAYEAALKHENAVIDGIRYPEDAEFFRSRFGSRFRLLFVTAPTETRFERMKSRARPGDPKTIGEFRHQDEMQEKLFRVSQTLKMSDYTIDNSGSMGELEKEVREFVSA